MRGPRPTSDRVARSYGQLGLFNDGRLRPQTLKAKQYHNSYNITLPGT